MSIGIDIIEIDRIHKIVDRNKFFLLHIFSKNEISQIKSKKQIYASIACRFCAKESFFKCVGTGITSMESLKEVQILNLENGKPFIALSGKLHEKYKKYRFDLSMSHCQKYACAVVQKFKS